MKIKICGLTNYKDANLALSLGADFLGFIFYNKSKRYVDPLNVQSILNKLKINAKTVGVFVDEKIEEILRVISITGIRIVQLHGSENQDFIEKLKKNKLHVFKTISVHNSESFDNINKLNPDRFLLDTYHPVLKGGSGKRFDWSLLKNKNNIVKNVIIAGGINAGNVNDLLNEYSPWGIDVSSGVEKSPGVKDFLKLRKLFDRIKK